MVKYFSRIILLGLFVFSPASSAWAQLSINFIAVNASETESKDIQVKYQLPRELEPKDVLDTGPLKVNYDVEKGVYFVEGTFRFAPKESRTYKIRINDVFRITAEEVEVIKKQLADNLDILKDSEIYSSAQVAKEKLDKELDFILTQQSNYSENVERRIEEYRAFVATLEQIRGNAFDLGYLEHESKAVAEMEQLKDTVKLTIEVTNPTKDKSRKVQHKHFLPKEVRADDVVDSRGFTVRFDEKKELAFLTKEEEFSPGETKRYDVLIKDVWKFPMVRADEIDKRVAAAWPELEGTIYDKSAKFLIEEINTKVKQIRDSQELTLNTEQHIGVFRLNEKRYAEAKNNCDLLEKLLSVVRAKKLKKLESGKVQNVLMKLKALRGLAALSDALFKKGISVTVTWRIIFATIGFIAIFTTTHFIIWAKRSGKMGEEAGLKKGEAIKVVPKPGQAKKEE